MSTPSASVILLSPPVNYGRSGRDRKDRIRVQAQLATHFSVSRQTLNNLLHGNAVLTAAMAIRFEKAFGVNADTLMWRQGAYELALARKYEGEIEVAPLDAMPTNLWVDPDDAPDLAGEWFVRDVRD